jgi:hypothetical protein
MGLDWIVAECAKTSISSISNAATACTMILFGAPMIACG